MPRGKTIVFVDNANIFHGQLKANWRIDFRKLQAYLEQGGQIWQTFFFASATDPPRYQQTAFYGFLRRDMHYEVLVFPLGWKTLHCPQCEHRWNARAEKGVDVALATKLLTLANNRAFETAILAGADKDYLETVRSVKANGLRVEIAAWRGTISPEMEAESSADVLYFNDVRTAIELTTPADAEAERLTAGAEPEEQPAGPAA
jgi:uncharacterized LabA/DUF88 family protein